MHLEFASLAHFARHRNASMMQFHNALANGEAYSKAGELGSIGRPEERVENMGNIFRTDANALIANLYGA